MAKRTPKSGYVYLVKSQLRPGHYKFGCTSLSTKERCKRLNRERKGYNFEVITSFKSKDIYKDEKMIKWHLLPYGAGFLGELFVLDFDDIPTEKNLIEMFLSIASKKVA